jgi:hypothetical protein
VSVSVPRLKELTARFLHDELDPEERDELAGILGTDTKPGDWFFLMAVVDSGCRRAMDATADDGRFIQSVLERLDAGKLSATQFLEGVKGRQKAQKAKPGILRWLLPVAAAAAAVLLIVTAGNFYNAPAPEAPRPAALAGLLEKAGAAKDVSDLKAIHPEVKTAYENELARGDDCNRPALVYLGLSTAVTGNPKEDRQAEDLRFALGLAWDARGPESRAAFRFEGMRTAEAGDVPSAGDGFGERYAAARKAAEERYYNAWNEKLGELSGGEAITHALLLERTYVTLYERGLAREAQSYAKTCRTGPAAEYVRDVLGPVIEKEVRDEERLEKAIDFRGLRSGPPGAIKARRDGSGPGGWLVEQTKTGGVKGQCIFSGPSFQQAVFACQVELLEEARPEWIEEHTWGSGAGFLDAKGLSSFVITVEPEHYRRYHLAARRFWVRMHMRSMGEGFWRMSLLFCVEGEQPWGFRRMTGEELQAWYLRARSEGRLVGSGAQRLKNLPDRMNLVLWTRIAMRCRSLGLEVVKE